MPATFYFSLPVPLFLKICRNCFRLCQSRSHLQVIVAPLMYRSKPFWYSKQLREIATQFSRCFSAGRPPNLHVLPSFINQDFLHDGVSLTPVAGLHYVLHFFDQAEAVLALAAADLAQKAEISQESSRYHYDRLAYLEQGSGSGQWLFESQDRHRHRVRRLGPEQVRGGLVHHPWSAEAG